MALSPTVTISDGSIGTLNPDGSVTITPRFTSIGGGEPSCPFGTTWDASLEECVEDPNVFTFCPQGQFWDDISGQCVTEIPTLPPIPGTGSTTTQGNVTVNVNNAVTVTDQTLSAVADAVKKGIQTGADEASNIAADTTNQIAGALDRVVQGIGSGIQNALSSVWDVLKGIGQFVYDNLKPIISAIGDNIGKAVGVIADAVKNAIGPIADTVASIAKQVQTINDTLIQPIANTITGAITTISTLTVAIERDLHSGLSGILQIPTDIANSLGSLDATLQRTVQQIGEHNKEVVQTTLGGTADDTIHTRLAALHDALTTASYKASHNIDLSDAVRLSDPGINEAFGRSFDAIWKEILTFVTTAFSSFKGLSGAFAALPLAIPFIAEAEWELPAALIGFVLAMIEAYQPALKYIEEDIAAKTGLAKLSPSDAIQAWRRAFIGDESLTEELAVNGWDAGRIKVLRDLAAFEPDISLIIDLYYRGILSPEQTGDALGKRGVAGEQQADLIAGSEKLFDAGLAVRSFQRSYIDEQALRDVLNKNRVGQAEQDAIVANALKPEGIGDLIERHKRQTLWSNGLIADTSWLTAPGDAIEAAKRDGLSPQIASDLWTSQFAVPPLQQWLTLYFRGVRTHTELWAAMDYYRVPDEWRDDFIRANSALIPFRSIPSMLADGLIGEAYAKQQLQAHGFDLTATEALLKLAATHKKAAVAVQASDLKSVSVQSARTAWNDGALTEQQYHDILLAHGFDEQAAALTIKVEGMQQHVKERKQAAQDIVDEALAGLITMDAATQQLANSQFSVAEQAKYLKQLRRGTTAKAKTPGEPELKKFWKAGVIEEADYRDALAQLGYAAKWIEAFVAVDTPKTATQGA